MLAELSLDECCIPFENLLGRIGFGFSHVAGSVLDFGRYCIACGCVGLAQACLDASIDYSSKRKQSGRLIKEHQLIKQMIAKMIVNIKSARLMCWHAGYLKENGDPDSIIESSMAKYFASVAANENANHAFQIHGANACSDEYSIKRYVRDAKIMEIIEGSTEIQYLLISKYGYQQR
jgi:alkylation response protein AidB-like acyl-CoA dehydrogenase